MKLIKKQVSTAVSGQASASLLSESMDRRAFLRRSGLAMGGLAAATILPTVMMRKASAEVNPPKQGVAVEQRRTVCTHCSVGCGIIAELQNGVWTGQEPDFASPMNLGGHCAKGAAAREHGSGEKRLKYPMKLVDGKWTRIGWDQAINEIGDTMLKIRKESGPDALFMFGSSKASNEGAHLQAKFAAFWGTNNVDNQARICHSTTVAGVAASFGYGAMTNSFNDLVHSKAMILIGANPAEAHPVGMQWVLRAKENGSKLIVVEPRFTRTAAHADKYVRIRPGSDIPFMYGLLYHVFKNGWENKDYIDKRVNGMQEVRAEAMKWTPDVVANVCGASEKDVHEVAKMLAQNRPSSLSWVMGGTQHHIGSSNTRLYCIFQLALGNIGVLGGGANIFRGHDNVQGATDIGPNSHTLPAYYGLAEGAWKHWCRVWDVDYEWVKGRFDNSREYDDGTGKPTPAMQIPGIPVSRWVDAVLEDKKNIQQRDNVRMMIIQGHAINSQTRGVEQKKALEKLDLLVICDPYPTMASVLGDRKNNTYLLPACTQYETYGSATATNRALQWRDKIIEPLFEAKPDHVVLYKLAKKLGYANELCKRIKIVTNKQGDEEPLIEDVLREINRGSWTIGYTGQSPERLKMHAEYRHTFNPETLRAEGGPLDGEYYGLPWPCWGTPEMKHTGTPRLWDPSTPVAKGGLPFRALWGTEHEGASMLADGVYPPGSDIKDGYPEFTYGILKKLGWDKDLTKHELDTIHKIGKDKADDVNWKVDLSGGIQRVAIKHGCAPFGNGKARAVVWEWPDKIPIHREPLYTPRYDLVKNYPTFQDRKAFYRLPTRYASIQAKDYSRDFPLVFTSGRLVEYEGGGAEQRSAAWLAELQQNMFVEINPADANNAGVSNGQMVWLESPEQARIKVMAMVTERVGRGVVWTPFHFGGWFQGQDLLDKYPEGTAPYVRGEACNTATTYGYDFITQMQETKATLCRIKAA